MRLTQFSLFTMLLWLPFLAMAADEDSSCHEDCEESVTNHSWHFCKGNVITLASELYHIERKRDGGTRQKGDAAGIRVSYDRLRRYKFYIGAQLFYGSGILRGHSGNDSKIRSRLIEKQVEGNLGYTFQSKCFPHVAFTPFAGYGYFREVNKFSPPSPISLQFTTRFRYISFGFLSSIYAFPCLTVGINGRFKWPWETRCKVSNDPDFNTIQQIVGDELHYRIELPITYFGSFLCKGFEIGMMPFYENRLYGARENFPFDFFKTRYTIYGVDIQLIYRF